MDVSQEKTFSGKVGRLQLVDVRNYLTTLLHLQGLT